MEKLIQKILLLGALLGMGFGAYAYLTEKPTVVVGKLEDRFDREMSDLRAEKNSDIATLRAGLEAKMDSGNQTVLQRLEKIDRTLDKMDDRLYEMQRRQLESANTRNDFDGG